MPQNFAQLVNVFIDLVLLVIPVIVSLSLLTFFWGLVKFIWSASEGDIDNGKNLMVWGVAALFVLVSVWGIIRFAQGELGLGILAIPFLPI